MSTNHLKRFLPLCLTLVMWLIASPAISAQITSVSGTVLDELDEPIIGAVIKEVNTNNSTITNIDGEFTLKLTSKKPSIEVNYLGYASVTEPVVKSNITIHMKPQANDLEEVVVVAYGQQKKVTVTGSVAAIGGAELKKSSEPNLSAALAGKLPGLTTIQNSGAPGEDDVTMYLRGAATTNGKSPLILVDGIPRESMSDIDPNEVASISVLKDASSTAVFGVRGANGVILITTKRGEEGSVSVHGQVQYSMQKFNRWPDAIPTYDYARLVNEARENDGFGQYATFSQTQLAIYDMWRDGKPTMDRLAQIDPAMAAAWAEAGYGDAALQFWYPNNDWSKLLLKDHSSMVQANVNISGGSKKLKYFVSAGYVYQGGMYKTESTDKLGYDPSPHMNRYNLRSNFDYKFNDVISASLDVATYLKKYNGPTGMADLNGARIAAVTQRPTTVGPLVIDGIWARNYNNLTNEDGSIMLIPASVGQTICDPTQTIAQTPWGNMNRGGYYMATEAQVNTIATLNLNFDRWVKGLSARALLSFESFASTRTTGSKTFRGYKYDLNPSDYPFPYLILDGSDTDADTHIAISRADHSRWFLNFQAQVNYNRTFNNVHNVTGMLLFQRDDKEDLTGSIPYRMIGTAGRFTYNYDSRYLAEINFGYNGSEQFAKGHRFGFFPAFSLGWVASSESFMKHLYETGWLTKLKFRASIGKVGNDVLSDTRFLYLDNMILGTSIGGMTRYNDAIYGNIPAPTGVKGLGGIDTISRFFPSSLNNGKFIYLTLIGNNDIHWETAWKQNYAVDITALKNLDITFDYFIEHRDEILMSRNTVPELGGLVASQLPQSNFGKVDNRGYEITAAYRIAVNKDINFSISGNFSYAKNKVVEADEVYLGDDYAYPYRTTGYSINQLFGYKRDYSVNPETGQDGSGFLNTPEQVEKYLAAYEWGLGTLPTMGDFIYQDINGDNVINDKDQAPIGYSNLLPRITYGVTLSGQLYGFDFSAMVQGTGQMSKYYSQAGFFESYGNMEYFNDMVFHDRWTPERYAAGLSSTHHRLALATQSASQMNNDYYIMDASYVRLKNVQIGYTLPKRLTKKIGMNTVRFYISADNVYTWTHLRTKNIDPEQNGFSSYPLMKTYTAGVSIDL